MEQLEFSLQENKSERIITVHFLLMNIFYEITQNSFKKHLKNSKPLPRFFWDSPSDWRPKKGAFFVKDFNERNNQDFDCFHPHNTACFDTQDEIIDLEGEAQTSTHMIIYLNLGFLFK